MSFIHYLFIGHFDRNSHGVRFAKPSPGEPFRIVVAQPIPASSITDVLREVGIEPTDGVGIPEQWSVWQGDGYLICDKYTHDEAEIEFLTRLIERTESTIYDATAHAEIKLPEWLASLRSAASPSAST